MSKQIITTNGCGYFDGAGAQVQRILSVVAFSKHFGFSYTLTPIQKVEIQPLDDITSELHLTEEITGLNSWICRRFEISINEDLEGYRLIKNPRDFFITVVTIFLSLVFSHSQRKEKLIFSDAYFLTKRKPKVWKLLALHSDIKERNQGSQRNLVAHVHLRISTFSSLGDRYIPIEYYRKIMDDLVLKTRKNLDKLEFVIHTDFNSPITDKEFFLNHATPESLKYWVKLGILKPNFEVDLEIISAARRELNELLTAYSGAHLFKGKTWASEWESMADADWLLISKSSFSLIGALLNQSGIVFAPKSWGPSLPHWVQLKA